MEDFNETKVIHQTVNGKYRVVFERSAVKGIDGFKVEANGDDIEAVRKDANDLYNYAQNITKTEVLNG